MDWKTFEEQVRTISSFIWDRPAAAENIKGVQIDCVLKLRPDYWILVEATKEKSLEKLRTDIAKFASLRIHFFEQHQLTEFYVVCEEDPPPSLITTAKAQNVTLLSLSSLKKTFFDYLLYHHARSEQTFGSAVDPFSGKKDERAYIPVNYTDVQCGKNYSIEDLSQLLLKGKRIIMLGSYGTGKSRCMQELFKYFRKSALGTPYYPLSIDLRDHWGTKRATEIIRRHFDDLGLSNIADAVVKVLDRGPIVLLLDGFDEIASQSWSDDAARLREIRHRSLAGARDLIKRSKGGLIITGRDHYFNSATEMFECLGLIAGDTTVVRCSEEFSNSEMQLYLRGISGELALPRWLPKRPLICSIISQIDPNSLKALMDETKGETSFWEYLISAICQREARIDTSLNELTIRAILRRLARLTRNRPADVGPISILEINRAFETIVGVPPVDESAVILQRLPALARVASDNPDRRFVDHYILDGLRAEDMIEAVNSLDYGIRNEVWLNPLRRLGLSLLADDMLTPGNVGRYMAFIKQVGAYPNRVLIGDILAGLLASVEADLDFGGLILNDSHISFLDLSHSKLSNLAISDSVIEELDVTQAQMTNVVISDCIIQRVYGIRAETGLPPWLKHNDIEQYEALSTSVSIRTANLTPAQRIFVSVVRKTFFQPGSGRKEEVLFRGASSPSDRRLVNKVLALLLDQDVLSIRKGEEGSVYLPNRKYSKRMQDISLDLNHSTDPLWQALDNL